MLNWDSIRLTLIRVSNNERREYDTARWKIQITINSLHTLFLAFFWYVPRHVPRQKAVPGTSKVHIDDRVIRHLDSKQQNVNQDFYKTSVDCFFFIQKQSCTQTDTLVQVPLPRKKHKKYCMKLDFSQNNNGKTFEYYLWLYQFLDSIICFHNPALILPYLSGILHVLLEFKYL